ncbi:hypothetical protein MKK63_10110 [Methylobacterium sp. J-088]|uniref:hypothetical protein n=1 Tax=Methylobacterium sp. J-088 TaxID=2836664 RepID=UPI001FBB4329|nr:hypothetical protein [Methylobacterium sp. J-088]MCJ2063062.1 hypothetical protein [Methylobacterium sp. J-088]
MGDVLTFTPRPKPVTGNIASEPLTGPALRASLEEAAQIALDAADRIIAVLDRMDGDADHEDGADDEPSLAAPENVTGSQVTWLRGNDQDGETEAPEIAIPDTAIEPPPAATADLTADPAAIHIEPLRWGGRGNVVALAGSTFVDLSAAAGGALIALARRS